jgi:small-conductance mechanosensitive channel
MVYRVLDDVTVAVHYLVMGYIVFGGFLAWRWRWTIYLHGVFIVWAVLSLSFTWAQCPLTYLENLFRQLGGEAPLRGGFIDTYITGVLYPENAVLVVQLICGAIVLTSWVGFYLRRNRTRPQPGAPARPTGGQVHAG